MNAEFAVFPLGTAFLPGEHVSLNVFESRYLDMLNNVMSSGRKFVSVLIARGSEVGGSDERFQHGVLIDIAKITSLEHSLLLEGTAISAITVDEWLPDAPFPRAMCRIQQQELLRPEEKVQIAKSLSLTAQRLRSLREKVQLQQGLVTQQPIVESAIASIASGRWWDELVTEKVLEEAMWLLARCVPCGPFDRYDLLRNATLMSRVVQLDRIIEHVSEMVEFQARD